MQMSSRYVTGVLPCNADARAVSASPASQSMHTVIAIATMPCCMLQVESKGQIFYAYTEAPEDRTRLLQKIDAARRVKITGDDGAALVRADAAKIAVSGGGRKVFSWGVGSMLGNNNQLAQAWALPQVIASLEAPHAAAELCAGPEHAACLSSEGGAQLWGSNEFQQVGVAGPAAIFRPIPLESLGSRKVLSIACGGSHTLAVVADSLDADGGAVVGWGTGTVGQLGLGQTQLLSAEPLVIPLPELYGSPVPVRRVAAGLVTSAAVLVTGECFVWGDSSLGRLGLPDIPDTLTPAGAPVLVNGKVTWTPRQVDFAGMGCDLGELSGRKVSVAGLGMGGAFTLFLLTAGDGSGAGGGGGAGGVLLVSGALGVDITKDRYGYPEDVLGPASALDALLESEVKGVARALTPRPVAPFGSKAVVLSVSAGARHAGAIALDASKGDAPRAYTAGKGWLGHGSDAPSLLLPRPTVCQTFAAVGGALAAEDGAFVVLLLESTGCRCRAWVEAASVCRLLCSLSPPSSLPQFSPFPHLPPVSFLALVLSLCPSAPLPLQLWRSRAGTRTRWCALATASCTRGGAGTAGSWAWATSQTAPCPRQPRRRTGTGGRPLLLAHTTQAPWQRQAAR